MGGGKERKMSGESATADHVKDRGKRLKQKLFKTESVIKSILLKKLSAQQDAEYLGLQGISISKHTSYRIHDLFSTPLDALHFNLTK